MSSIIDYTDRATCPIFGDGGGGCHAGGNNGECGDHGRGIENGW